MLIDHVEVTFRGGRGGNGMLKKVKGPDGGCGGNGGNVYVIASSDLTLLTPISEQPLFKAENGQVGARNNKKGRQGDDLIIPLPVGTSLVDIKNGETICDLNFVGQKELVCQGGRGGLTTEDSCIGQNGEEKKLILDLKLIADFGLIGLPNAGKSSLLNELTSAKAKVANYAFTTLEPNLGVLEGKYIADIPGLIEGASTGKGLGTHFLKHIEKVGKLIHCISSESEDVARDYEIVRTELGKYNEKLTQKQEIVVLTKTDIFEPGYIIKLMTKLSKLVGSKDKRKVFSVSIHDLESLEKLKKNLLFI